MSGSCPNRINKLTIIDTKEKFILNIQNYKSFLIIDFEATCCNHNSIVRSEMEIIEIGAVLVESENLTSIDEFNTFVRPVRHSTLTPFCTELTSITQADVDSAPSFSEAINLFKSWVNNYHSYLFCSWGDYDKKQLEQDCSYHQVSYPLCSPHLNIKKQFSDTQNLKKKLGMAAALKRARIPLDGTHHRGIDDARNMAKLMPFILGRKSIPR